MGDSAATDGVPKSRQKNCNSCVQAKRRCDRRAPICSRCVKKKTPCIYDKNNVASQPDREDFELSYPSTGSQAFGSPACSPFVPRQSPVVNYLEFMPMDFQLGFATTATESLQNYATDAAIGDDITMNSFVNLMDNSIAPNHDQWLVPMEQGPVTERSISPADEEILRAYGKMADFCVSPIQLSLPVEYSVVVRKP